MTETFELSQKVQKIQNEYFQQYQLWCENNPFDMNHELQFWKKNKNSILYQTIEQQSACADFVTRKMCANQSEEIILFICRTMFDKIPPKHSSNTCSIGNIALYIICFKKLLSVSMNERFEILQQHNDFIKFEKQKQKIETEIEKEGCVFQ